MAVNEDLPGLHARYASLKMPAGVIFGVDDRILDAHVHGAPMTAQVPGLSYETIEAAGHMIPLTRPDRVAAFIEGMAERAFGRPA